MRFRRYPIICTLVALLAIAGCRTASEIRFDDALAHCQQAAQQVEYPDTQVAADLWAGETALKPPPTVRRFAELEYVPLTLEEAIQQALTGSEVIRQAGGRIVSAPNATATIHDPAMAALGVEAALSAFDADFFAKFYYGDREREYNSRAFNQNYRFRDESGGQFTTGFTKVAATGTQFKLDADTVYARSNVPTTRVPSSYETTLSASIRHPLMQGGGLEFNRIAGPGAGPGVYRGVLIARLNQDVALADFEMSVQNLVRDVERAYWELYFAYREVDARQEGRRYALEAWQLEQQRVAAGGRPADQEAFVREQFYAAQMGVENAISGDGGQPGILGAERELRSLLGLPASDGRLLRPSTPPLTADIIFDWEESLGLGVMRRVELRRQRWKVKQRELELIAARNQTRIRLDLVAQYQQRGFGDDLWGGDDDAVLEAFRGDMPGWIMGFEMQTPIGQRMGHAAVRNAELQLRREEALLREQERQVSLELRAAFAELDRAFVVSQTCYNRHVAAQTQLAAESKRNTVGSTRLELVLDAQRRAVVAEVALHRAIADYNLALSRLNLARGTLLESAQVRLAETPPAPESSASAVREARRFQQRSHPVRAVVPAPVSLGEYQQRWEDSAGAAAEPQPTPAVGRLSDDPPLPPTP